MIGNFRYIGKKFEWANPRSRDERKNPFYVSTKNIRFRDNDKPVHWVGQSKLRSLYIYKFFKYNTKI